MKIEVSPSFYRAPTTDIDPSGKSQCSRGVASYFNSQLFRQRALPKTDSNPTTSTPEKPSESNPIWLASIQFNFTAFKDTPQSRWLDLHQPILSLLCQKDFDQNPCSHSAPPVTLREIEQTLGGLIKFGPLPIAVTKISGTPLGGSTTEVLSIQNKNKHLTLSYDPLQNSINLIYLKNRKFFWRGPSEETRRGIPVNERNLREALDKPFREMKLVGQLEPALREILKKTLKLRQAYLNSIVPPSFSPEQMAPLRYRYF